VRIHNGQPQQIGTSVGGANAYKSRALDGKKSSEGASGTSVSIDRTRVSEEAREMSAHSAQFDDSKVDRLRASRSVGQLVAHPEVIAARIMQED
jgi:anti-sigma28 factor (negative regulator of flagellin synthesis)